MDAAQFLSQSPEDQAKTLATLRGLIGALEGKQVDANDARVVWFQNRFGVRDVTTYGYWRTYMGKHLEQGWRLLNPDECAEEETKVAQAAAHRSERAREWRRLPTKIRQEYGGPDALSLEDMRALNERAPAVDQNEALTARVRELEALVAAVTATPHEPRRRNRTRKLATASAAE